MSTQNTGQLSADSETGRMGVASLPSKRRLEAVGATVDYPIAPKQPRKSSLSYDSSDPTDSIFTNGLEKCSSEFLTTSILARTLLTSSSPTLTPLTPCSNNGHSTNPLESLKSSLEALPTPMFLESLEELQVSSPLFCSLPKAQRSDLEFSTLLSGDTSLSTVNVLSPIDQTSADWVTTGILPLKNPNPVPITNDQLITEDENGKSYFNLGPSEATVLAKKSCSPGNSPPDQTWTSSSSSTLDYLDESSSSSSCESISSEDLFNSCEEFDEASEDEEEVRSYKQQRSTVLHLSLCKLNSFRNQQCAEPSLHRSVLICNTLRHIEQEIRQEDEVKKNETNFLQSRETLPPFWSTNSRNSNDPHSTPTSNPSQLSALPVLPNNLANTPSSTPSLGHDPYLSSSSPYNNDSPYSIVSSPAAYDYNSPIRPQQTPFHTPSYDYSESDLSSPNHQSSTLLGFSPSPVPSLLDSVCDSGYGEDNDLYYYTPSPNSIKVNSREVITGDNCYLACSSDPTPNNYSCSVSTQAELHLNMTRKENAQYDITKSKNKSSCSLISNNNIEDGSGCATDQSDTWSKFSSPPSPVAISSFAQQESQCGMESLRSDLFLGGNPNGHSIHYQLPMDSLISPNYSATT